MRALQMASGALSMAMSMSVAIAGLRNRICDLGPRLRAYE
jgi:hypothetical protein